MRDAGERTPVAMLILDVWMTMMMLITTALTTLMMLITTALATLMLVFAMQRRVIENKKEGKRMCRRCCPLHLNHYIALTATFGQRF